MVNSSTVSTHYTTAAKRDFSLDFTRSVAIIGIFLFHLGPKSLFTPVIARLGDIGIIIFITVSGYVLGKKYDSTAAIPFKEFISKRLIRILPAYWVSLILLLLSNYILYAKLSTLPDILTHILGIHALLFPAYASSISANLWFISLVVSLYLCFPLLVKHINRFNFLSVLGILLILHYVMLKVFYHVEFLHEYLKFKGIAYQYPLFIFNVLPFSIGILYAKFDRKGTPLYKVVVAVIVALYFVLIKLTNPAIGIILFTCLSYVPKNLHVPPVLYFARYSYEFYLLHHAPMAFVAYYFYKYIHPNWIVFSLVYGTFIFIGAIVVHKFSNWLIKVVASRL